MPATEKPRLRLPVAAGLFYEQEPAALRAQCAQLLSAAPPATGSVPKALILPHAGYSYSGRAAAAAIRLTAPARDRLTRVVALGPSHRMAFFGLAASSVEGFVTPLGTAPIASETISRALCLPQVRVLDGAHRQEHSLEVLLPLLQTVLPRFALAPLLVGEAGVDEVAEVWEVLWGGEETLLVCSTDLSHYHDYAAAQTLDAETSQWIERGAWQKLDARHACGYAGLRGLLKTAVRHACRIEKVAAYNSGDVGNRRDKVVGYGSYAIY
jgi:AmmeMemoRadiSam system protein B